MWRIGTAQVPMRHQGPQSLHQPDEYLAVFFRLDRDVEEAFHHPRIDISGGANVVADEAHTPEVLDALRKNHEIVTAPRSVFPYAFACPAGVMREGDQNSGCTEVMSPWGDSALELEE